MIVNRFLFLFLGHIGEANHVCESPYTTIDDSSLCEEIAEELGVKFIESSDWSDRPTGCISNQGESKFFFNTNQNNVPKSNRKPVCIPRTPILTQHHRKKEAF